jgi:hypothetical protein
MVRMVTVTLVAVVLGGLVATSACEKTTTSGGTTRYSNDQFGISFEITDRFEQGEEATGTGSTDQAAFSVVFLDPDGVVVDDIAVDTLKVSVYELGQEITPDLMPDFKASLDSSLTQLQQADPTMQAQALTETTVNGVPGWKTDYTKSVSDVPINARTYFLVAGTKEYQITMWSAQENWSKNEPDLQAAVDSFTVE